MSRRTFRVVACLFFCSTILPAQSSPPTAIPSALGIDYDIVVCRAPVANAQFRNAFPDAANFSLYMPRGTDLFLIHPDGSEELLYSPGPNGACADPVVSFDGKWVYFTKFDDPQNINTQRGVTFSPVHIMKVNVVTKAVVQLTFGATVPYADTAHAVDPQYALIDAQPVELPDGDILFLSNRSAMVAASPTTVAGFPAMTFWRMNADGGDLRPIERFTLEGCQHPFILKDGRIVWTHMHVVGRRALGGGNNPLFIAEQDMSNINVFAGEHIPNTAWHFATQLSGGDIVTCVYYHQNNYGHGTLVRFPVDPVGQNFTPINQQTNFYQYAQWGATDSFRRVGETLVTPWSLTPFVPDLSYDQASVVLPDGTRAGKSTMPSGAPNGDLVFVWSNGNVNDLYRPVPELPHMKVCFAAGAAMPTRNSMTILKESAAFHYLYPKAVVPYRSIYGIAKPPRFFGPANDGAIAALPAGGPFATTGTSSVYNRESAWPPSYNDPWDANIVNSWALGTAFFSVGQDSHPFQNSSIFAAQVVADMSHADTRYADLSPGFLSHNEGSQIWGVLGEVPLRKTNAQGQPILDMFGDPDTSYEVRIPADTPFHNRIIDQRGLMLTAEWTWHGARPGERKTNCGGCHAHSTSTAPLEFSTTAAASPNYGIVDFALQTPMIDETPSGQPTVTLMPERVRIVEYHRDVKPILVTKCVGCHGDVNPQAGLDLSGDDAVMNLAFNTPPTMFGFHQATRWVRRHSAAQSLIAWKAYGQRLDGRSNGDRGDDVDFTGTIMPPPSSGIPALTFQEKRTIALWIDLGCLTDLTPGVAAIGDPFDDQMAPTLVCSGFESGDHLGSPSAITIGVYDLHRGVAPSSLNVTVTPAGGATGQNLAAATTITDGGVYQVALPPMATNVRHVISVSVADQAGNIARRAIPVVPRDLLLTQDDLLRGQTADLTVRGGAPGETIYFVAGVTGIGAGPCYPTIGGLCLDVNEPLIYLGSAPVGGNLTAILPVSVPGTIEPIDVFTQALVLRGVGFSQSAKSNPVASSVLP